MQIRGKHAIWPPNFSANLWNMLRLKQIFLLQIGPCPRMVKVMGSNPSWVMCLLIFIVSKFFIPWSLCCCDWCLTHSLAKKFVKQYFLLDSFMEEQKSPKHRKTYWGKQVTSHHSIKFTCCDWCPTHFLLSKEIVWSSILCKGTGYHLLLLKIIVNIKTHLVKATESCWWYKTLWETASSEVA